MTEPAIPRGQAVASYGGASFGALLGFSVVPLLFLYYLTEYAGVPPAWAGTLLALPKVADLLLDPLIGRGCDRYARAHGGRATLIGLSVWALPVLLVLLFVPLSTLPLWMRIGVPALLLIAQSLLTTVFAVAHTGLASDLAQTLASRGTLMSARAIGSTLASLVVSALGPGLVAAYGDGTSGYLSMALTLAGVSALLLGVAWRTFRGTPMRSMDESQADMRLLRALRATLPNRAFWAIVMMVALFGGGAGTLIALLPYVNQHLLHGTSAQLPWLLMPIFGALLIGVAAAPRLLRCAGPVQALATGYVIALTGVLVLAAGPRQWAPMITGALVFGLGAGLLTVLIITVGMQIAAKASAAGESLGLYLGVQFSAEKLGASAGGIIAGFGLDWAGLGSTASGLNLDRLAGLWLSVPVLTISLCLLILTKQRVLLALAADQG